VCNVTKVTHDKIETLTTGLYYQTWAEAASQLTRLSFTQDEHKFLKTSAVKPHLDLSVTQKISFLLYKYSSLSPLALHSNQLHKTFTNLEKSE
jgi:hypothetical protein